MKLTRRSAARLLSPLLLWGGTAPAEESGAALLEKARESCWGAAGAPPRDYSYELTTEINGPSGKVRLRSKVSLVMPNTFRQDVSGPTGNMVLMFDGESAWRVANGAKQPLPEDAGRAQASDLQRRHVLFAPAPEEAWVRPRGSERVGEVDALGIEIADVGGSPLRLFLHPETMDVVKTVFVGDVPGGGMAQVEELLDDHRDVEGYRWAHRRRVSRNGKFASLQTLSEVRVNAGLQRSDILA